MKIKNILELMIENETEVIVGMDARTKLPIYKYNGFIVRYGINNGRVLIEIEDDEARDRVSGLFKVNSIENTLLMYLIENCNRWKAI